MRALYPFLLMVSAISFAGCATPASLPSTSRIESAVDFADALVRSTSRQVSGRRPVRVDRGFSDGYEFLNAEWCAQHSKVTTVSSVVAEFMRACRTVGGVYRQRTFCRGGDTPDSVLFIAKVREADSCQRGVPISLNVVEPLTTTMALDFLERVHAYEKTVIVERENTRRENLAIWESMKSAKVPVPAQTSTSPTLTTAEWGLGTRICRDGVFNFTITTGTIHSDRQAPGTLVAQVDGFAEERLRIRFRVLGFDIPSRGDRHAPYASAPSLGDFQATAGLVYWDFSNYWRACN